MDTVSWLSFFTASGLGAALGVLSLTALGACLYLRAPGQRRLAILAAALGCVLVLQYGGGALLEERGLFWRGWVQTALSLTGGGLAVLLLAGTIRGLGALCLGKDWVTAVCVLGCAAALLGAAALGLWLLGLGRASPAAPPARPHRPAIIRRRRAAARSRSWTTATANCRFKILGGLLHALRSR